MIPTKIAQKFVDRFCATIRYNVNVMDTDGIIIAAGNAHRIGMYHETAHAMVLANRTIAVVPMEGEHPPGVAPGVNLPLRQKGGVIGVVGVTGDAEEVAEVAHTVRTAIEAMLEYETEREQLEHRQDRKKILIDALLYQESVDPTHVNDLARRCGYDLTLPRMPIVFEVAAESSPQTYLEAIKSSAGHSKQDLSFVCPSGHATVFKVVPSSNEGIMGKMRSCFLDYCHGIDEECEAYGLEVPIRCASGPVQDAPDTYRISLRTALWTLHTSHDRFADFSGHTHELFLHSIAPEIWHGVFDSLVARMHASPLVDDTNLDQLGKTFMVMREENMSPKRAAERLGIHRNTVVFRMSKLSELCGLDPVSNWREREMLYLLFGHMLRQSPRSEARRILSEASFVPSIRNYHA